MTKDEFSIWFKQNIDLMVEMGVLHPESPSGKTVRLAVSSLQPELNSINERIDRLERLINNKEELTKEQITQTKKVVHQIKNEVKVLNEKPKQSAWLVQKKEI